MRILLTTDPIGGVWTFTRELSCELLRQGHRVHLLSFGRALSQNQEESCACTTQWAGDAFSWEVSEAPLEWMQGNDRTWESGVDDLNASIARFLPDVLHTSQFCFGALGGALPCVITAHSDVLSWSDACRPQGLEQSKWLDTYRALVSRGLNSVTALAAPTRWMADALSRHWALKQPISVIANGRSVTGAAGDEPRKMQALSVGRLWDEGKGVATLLERQWPMPVLVAGEENFGDARVESGSQLRALGMLSEEQMLAVMRESAIYIATSIYEPFGLAPLEAAQCGCALVLRNIPSFREVWDGAALYFEDADDLYTMLERLRKDEALLSTMRQAAMTRAANYSASSMAAAYLDLYDDAIAAASTREPRLEFHAA